MYRNKNIKRLSNWEDIQQDLDNKLRRAVQEEFAAYFKSRLSILPGKKRSSFCKLKLMSKIDGFLLICIGKMQLNYTYIGFYIINPIDIMRTIPM